MSDNSKNLFRQKLELLIVDGTEEVLNRAKQVISRHYLTFQSVNSKDLVPGSLGELLRAQVILIAQNQVESSEAFIQRATGVLKVFPRSRMIAVGLPGFQWSEAVANVSVLSSFEFLQTLKFEYLCLLRCRGQFQSISSSDLFPMTSMSFPAFIRLSLNQRYLAVVYSNTVLSDDRFQRLVKAEGGLYIQNKDSEKYLEYIKNYFDTSGKSMHKRARASFLAIYSQCLQLNEFLLFDLVQPNEVRVGQLYQDLKKLIESLFDALKSDADLWDVFREALEEEPANYWRAPWIATYSALIAIKGNQGDPMVAFLAALFTDLGIFDLEDSVTREYLFSSERKVLENQQSQFEKHPILSLNRALIKKLPIEDSVKSVLVCTHERADQKGFPNQVPTEMLPIEAQIVMFAEKIDQAALTKLKETGTGFRFQREKVWEHEKNNLGNFSSEFLDKIAEALI
ncbi:HD-GYP domain-containing protein [Bdellovibrio reynosensis]|uniref:Uncharacterized protein n=1 Tax=Bdellovibrio reynosensis TaxID=2835041 RepID=A0ABY4CEU9_9BACT|nr:hypothetical protein [Bdellovibrio reynosensis]UOF02191.1 hypothetical protein MNR06_04390 [Bdellovibrio reynosensis]